MEEVAERNVSFFLLSLIITTTIPKRGEMAETLRDLLEGNGGITLQRNLHHFHRKRESL